MYYEKLMSIMKELHKISGFKITIFNTDYDTVAEYPQNNQFCSFVKSIPEANRHCVISDSNAFKKVKETGKSFLYHCNFGLIEAISPLYHNGVLSGYLMMGQVLSDSPDAHLCVRNAVKQFTLPRDTETLIPKIPVIKSDMVASYVNIMTICAEYITMKNVMPVYGHNLAEQIKIYLGAHFAEDITLGALCKTYKCSKTTLINTFNKAYGKTVYRYLTEIRLKNAAELLKNGSDPIGEISGKCGFVDQCYFSKVFKKETGLSPSEFRTSSAAQKEQ